MALYTLPKQYHPDFSQPNKKPIGDAEIDWSNPLTKNIRLFVIFNSAGLPYDLVTGKFLSTTNNPVQTVSIRGKQLSFDGVNQSASIPVDLSNTANVTVLTGYSWDSYSNNDDFAFEFTPNANHNNNNGFFSDPNGSSGGIALATNHQTTASRADSAFRFTRPSNGYHDYIFRYASVSNGITGWVDGIEQSMTNIFDNTGSGTYEDSALYIASRNNSALFGEVDYNYLILFDEDITDKNNSIQAHKLTKNPYQILKPKAPVIYFTASDSSGITVTEQTANTNYTSLNPTVTLTGSISITESTTNTNYTSLNPAISFTGTISVVEQTTNTNYEVNNPTITLSSSNILVTESTVNTQYESNNPSILLTPEPLGIVSTVCFNGVLVDLEFNGKENNLAYNGQSISIEFNGDFNQLEFNGTIQLTCNTGSIKTNC